ncbi:ABC transporter substrate-binding protein [Micromonospora sp. DR5-3]|uniref:ABC transporter substrate-binding protein n=1 Tax=unclassified Micromonospora TaxID=2617518 RepID=UPI0011D48E10|nr:MULTISPECIES: ABC transporter substrate-binding protein [unclassified Micromonospora]MCW3815764.1 ABC transporter substrate-binding protein [Micromonospora sp. DR5-3]TYC21056.1 substrate-binding domain-containing protein [Micromonospora sp. MP36]
MQRRRLIALPTAALVAVLGITGCSGDAGGSGAGRLDISLLTTYNGLPFYTAMQCGAQDAAKELGGDIKITAEGPSRGMNAADQIPVLEGVVNRHPDGMIFVPADPVAMLAPAQTAISAGIPMVTADASLQDEIAMAQFRGDNKAGGRLAAEELVRRVGERRGKILVLDVRPGLPVTNLRAEGFIEALKELNSGLEVLKTQYHEDDPTKAAVIVESALQSNPDIVGIFGTSEAASMGAASALQARSTEDITVIAFDAGPSLVQALKDGVLDALVAQGSYRMGYDGVKTLVAYLRDGKKPASFDNVIDSVIVTAKNVDEPDVAKMLYPASCS